LRLAIPKVWMVSLLDLMIAEIGQHHRRTTAEVASVLEDDLDAAPRESREDAAEQGISDRLRIDARQNELLIVDPRGDVALDDLAKSLQDRLSVGVSGRQSAALVLAQQEVTRKPYRRISKQGQRRRPMPRRLGATPLESRGPIAVESQASAEDRERRCL